MARFERLSNNIMTILTIVGLVLLVAVIGVVWQSSRDTLNTLNTADQGTPRTPSNIVANQQLINNIDGYSQLPSEARAVVVGTLQNACSTTRNLTAKVQKVTAERVAELTVSCSDKSTLTSIFAKLEEQGRWSSIYSGATPPKCEQVSSISHLAQVACSAS